MIRTARDLKAALTEAIRERSGFIPHRTYLGMSGIGYCPRQLYFELLQERPPLPDGAHWRCWAGLMYEQAIGDLLAIEVGRCRETLVAPFDDRYRGHVDFQTPDGRLLVEVKTVTWEAFHRIRVEGVFPDAHQCQVQAYLQHGPWEQAVLLYMGRDIPNNRQTHIPIWTFNVYLDETIGAALDAKARMVLDAYDRKVAPDCTCGRHKG